MKQYILKDKNKAYRLKIYHSTVYQGDRSSCFLLPYQRTRDKTHPKKRKSTGGIAKPLFSPPPYGGGGRGERLLFLFLLFPLLLSAQPQRSLDDCIRLAWQQNPGFKNTAIDIKESRMNYVASIGNFLPRVTVDAQAGRNFGRSIDPNTNGYTTETFDEGTVGLDMTLSLFEGFSRINRVRFERLNTRHSQWERRERQNELAYRVTDAYFRLLLEEKMLELASEQSKLSERYLKQTEAFVELGLKSVSDLQEVRARREGDIYRYQARDNSCRMASLQLKQLLNLQEGDTLAVLDTISYEALPLAPIPATADLYARSLVVMPSMKMIELQQKAARKEFAMAGGRFSPSVYARFSMSSRYLDGFSSRQLNDNLGKYVGIGISFPLLSGLERLTTLRKYKLNIYRLRNDGETARQQLYTDVEQTVLSLRAGRDEHRQALQQLRAEKLVLKESERKWEEGLISVFQLMEARNRFISAKAELVRTRLQVELTRKLSYYYSTGSFI